MGLAVVVLLVKRAGPASLQAGLPFLSFPFLSFPFLSSPEPRRVFVGSAWCTCRGHRDIGVVTVRFQYLLRSFESLVKLHSNLIVFVLFLAGGREGLCRGGGGRGGRGGAARGEHGQRRQRVGRSENMHPQLKLLARATRVGFALRNIMCNEFGSALYT